MLHKSKIKKNNNNNGATDTIILLIDYEKLNIFSPSDLSIVTLTLLNECTVNSAAVNVATAAKIVTMPRFKRNIFSRT